MGRSKSKIFTGDMERQDRKKLCREVQEILRSELEDYYLVPMFPGASAAIYARIVLQLKNYYILSK